MRSIWSHPHWFVVCLMVVIVLGLGGCDELTGPVKIQTSPNTFKLNDARRRESIRGVKVYNAQRELVWEIRATTEVPAQGFVVTVGSVPPGFVQVTPSPPQTFVVTPGKQYWIEMDANLVRTAHSIPIEWVADQTGEGEAGSGPESSVSGREDGIAR